MATLEKIRSKQKLLFTIVIIALFLFIISIADANSIRNFFGAGPGSTVAQVGNIKIDYDKYREQSERVNQQRQQQQQDRDVMTQNIIQQLLGEALMQEQYDQLGIKVTDAEISRAMTGTNPHPAAMQFISGLSQALQLSNADGNAVLDAIKNPARYNLSTEMLNNMAQYYFGQPTMLDAWAQQEKAVEQAIQQQAFGKLMGGLFTANELDARSVYNDNNTMSNISYVTAPYASVKDDEVEITDADLKNKWNEIKSMYKIDQETRDVDYIAVPVQPSVADYNAAEVEVDKAVEALSADTANVVLASYFVQDPKMIRKDDIKKDRDLSLIPDSLLKKGAVYKYRRMQNTFRIAKVNNVTPQIDSIRISMYVAPTAAAIDSVFGKMQAGETTFQALVEENPNVAADSVWQTMVGAPEYLVSVLENAPIGQAFVYNDSVQNAHAIYKVSDRKAPKQYADITLYTYVVDPSVATVTDIKTKLNGFLASNHSADKFTENADSMNYMVRHARITSSTPKLGYVANAPVRTADVADTRHAIKWAMNAKKGEVSPIFEDNRDYYVVVAVKDIFTDKYIPHTASDVNAQLTEMVKADKKAAKLIEKYQGKAADLNGYAQLMNAEVLTDSTVVFTSPRLGSLFGNEYELHAQVAAAAPGTVVGPVQGANEVMVFVVNGTSQDARPYNFTQDGNTFVSMFGFNNPFALLAGDRKVKNNMLKFENYDK